jgi:hypothetical protein
MRNKTRPTDKFHSKTVTLLAALALATTGFLLSLGATVLADSSSNCYSIQNTDSKNLCLALVKKNKSNCYSISSSDLKNMCLAQVGEQRSNCYSIQSSDMKNLCLAMVR